MKISFFILSLFLMNSVYALDEVPVDPILSKCKPYPEIKSTDPIPSTYRNTNDLSRPVNNAFYNADGEKIVIYGRVMDKNCLPVSDAHIFIWQSNSKGYVQYKTKSQVKPKWIDRNFTGTGSTSTDNLGRFNFITIMPGSLGKKTPYINIKVTREDLDSLRSKVYFLPPDDKYIVDNISIKKPEKIAQVTAVKGNQNENGVTTYFIDITLNHIIEGKEY